MTKAPDTPAAPPPGRTPRWVLPAYATAVLAGTVAGWGGRWYWLLDLASHFRSIWLVLAVAGLVACLRWRSRLAAACLALAAAGNAAEMLPYWLPARGVVTAAATGQRVTLVVANVHRLNDDATAAVAYLRDRRPDVAAVLEVDPAWAAALEGLADVFPHRVVRPRTDNFGIALLSRWPLDDVAVVDFGVPDRPSIVATVRGETAPFRLIATHPSPPFNGRATAVLNTHLAAVAAAAAASPLPCIVAGDFNATPWSHPFRTLVAKGGLRDTALGRGVQATWNAHYPVPRIPIDHILAPPNATVVRRVVGPDIGSDHFPVEAELILPSAR